MSSEADLVIDVAEQITPAWLSLALGAAGHEVEVRDVRATPVGTGQMGSSYRLDYELATEATDKPAKPDVPDLPDLPETFVLKLPTRDIDARAMVATGYRNEVIFYRHVAASITARIPACHLAVASEDWTAFALLLEDLAPATQGDQLAGCGLDAMIAAATNLAGLHAPRWCDASIWDVPTVKADDEEGVSFLAAVFDDAVGQFIDRLGDLFDADDLEALRALPAALPRFMLGRPERFAVLHGDYRLDNLMFHPDGTSVAAVDWQGMSVGLPGRDLAYLVATGLLPDQRVEAERQVVERYHDELVAQGVEGYDLETCFDDYRFGMFQGPMIGVLGAVYASTSARGDVVLPTMVQRSLRAIRELDSLGAM